MEQNILITFGAYAVFLLLGAFLITVPVVVGAFLRPKKPNAEKLSIYECGEPTIGSSWIRYNIRFYSTALDFLIFDVEVVLLLPVAVALLQIGRALGAGAAFAAFGAMSFFFVVLALGLAYAWRWGSIDWIRGGQTDVAVPTRPAPKSAAPGDGSPRAEAA
jgi:NADH-quinone oxidoreductase subunit A